MLAVQREHSAPRRRMLAVQREHSLRLERRMRGPAASREHIASDQRGRGDLSVECREAFDGFDVHVDDLYGLRLFGVEVDGGDGEDAVDVDA